MWKPIVGSIVGFTLFVGLVWMVAATSIEEKQERVRLETARQAKIEALCEKAKGKKITNVYWEHKSVSIVCEDGTLLKIHSVAHHSAGAHLEIDGK